MAEHKIHTMPLLKAGVGHRIFLMFSGRRSSGLPVEIPAKSGEPHWSLAVFLVMGTALLIGVVLWSRIRTMF